jgi:hypothetical protein
MADALMAVADEVDRWAKEANTPIVRLAIAGVAERLRDRASIDAATLVGTKDSYAGSVSG